jgi:GAF domain-containing protein
MTTARSAASPVVLEVVMPREALLARTMVELADNLVDDFDIVDLLTTLSDRCVEVLDIAAAGIMLAAPDGRLRAMTASSEAMRVVELFELQSDEGPCLDCFHTGQPVVNQNLTIANGRWPRFAPVAVEAGFLAADAIPMRLRGQVIGALNLFRTEIGSLTADDVAVAQALADIATIAILQNRGTVETQTLNEQLTVALSSRIVIEQAKGMIAERHDLPIDRAFERLRRHARNHNLRLADLARDTVNGHIDPATFKPPPA